MGLLHYIDNEPASGEWASTTEVGGSTITRGADGAWPERGSYGLRVSLATNVNSTTDPNWAYKSLALSRGVAAGEAVYLGQWVRVTTFPSRAGTYAYANFGRLITGGSYGETDFYLHLWNDNGTEQVRFVTRDDAGGWHIPDVGELPPGAWHWVVGGVRRASSDVASDGWARLYVDGTLAGEVTGIDNYDEFTGLSSLQTGTGAAATSGGGEFDVDEIKIADAYPEPYVAPASSSYPCAESTAVLFRQTDSDSREFADYCASELGIPRGLLIPLPNAGSDEALADYATFETQVEDDLNTWLTTNSTNAAQIDTFLIGYGVPVAFTEGGVKHSAASRLMNLDAAFSSQTTNPFYDPTTVARLTHDEIRAEGYCCTRIDADSLAHAKAIIDAAAAVSALSGLTDADKLYSDDTTYKASLACQYLRILTAALAEYSSDAFVWGDTGDPSFISPAGSRVCFTDDSDDAADTLRATSEVFDAVVTNGYAAAMGCCGTADTLDAESFFEMLRLGGTLAEAFLVSIRYWDYTAVPVGDPTMTVAFQRAGYNVYRGRGGVENVDFCRPVAYLRRDRTEAVLAGLGHDAGARYTYVVRPVRGPAGLVTPDLSCRVEFETDAAGEWVGRRPTAVRHVEAACAAGGVVRLRWSWFARPGEAPPAEFRVYRASRPRVDLDEPATTVACAAEGDYAVDLAGDEGQTCYLAVTARSTEGVESHPSEVIGPFVSRAAAPPAPPVHVEVSF